MILRTNITKRKQTRKQRDGSVNTYDRYVLSYTDPKTGKRAQKFFAKQKEALAAQQELILAHEKGTLANQSKAHTVRDAYELWFSICEQNIKKQTLKGYSTYENYICGPLLEGTDIQRRKYAITGEVPKGCKLHPMLGDVRIAELTTADIRKWRLKITELVGHYTARRSGQRLKASLELAAEEYGLRPPTMPKQVGKGQRKKKKTILTPVQIAIVLDHARQDKRWGLYYAFPFLAGTRPSEQLALHWDDVDFEKNVIRIHRMLEKNGEITNFTKTEAGMRDVPMFSTLREWLMEWKLCCPRHSGKLELVFPSQGAKGEWPLKKIGGGVLLYSNFRKRVWVKAFEDMAEKGVPYVTPHSGRHSYISTLQATGAEVGLVARIAGHSDPAVTLGFYTQSVRDGQDAVEKLSLAYQARPAPSQIAHVNP